jgi:uncharacterized protein YyaL (SSP411 family)
MEHESFEDPQTAQILNDHFVSIKVDREERPDLDAIYMNAVVSMTGQGGWPTSVFLTPDGKPFYGGTYFPSTPRYNMPAFSQVLLAIQQTWENDRAEIDRISQGVVQAIRENTALPPGVASSLLLPESLQQAADTLLKTYDWSQGGWGRAPRFPQPMVLEFLLLQAARGNEKARQAAVHALTRMSMGGMYDVVGGGFHRYSTDDAWLIPHFEKMLYDNAQLARVYLHASLLTGSAAFQKVCTETLDFMLREMAHPEGGFYSSLDADSEGGEGAFYAWTREEINSLLTDDRQRDLFFSIYPVTEVGNFEGKTVLQRRLAIPDAAAQSGMNEEEMLQRLDEVHGLLLEARSRRPRPATDDKILVAWNALALRAYAEAARLLNRPDYLQAAQKCADFLLRNLLSHGRLFRAWRSGMPRHSGFLEDYAGLILGLIELYQTDANLRWFQAALQLTQEMQSQFRDSEGGFFDTGHDQEPLITRPKEVQDNALPSGNALAAMALLALSSLDERSDWRVQAEGMLAALQDHLVRYPLAFGFWLQALDFALGPVRQIAIIGPLSAPQTQQFLAAVNRQYRPRTILAASAPGAGSESPALLNERRMIQEKPTAYVCQGFVCQTPVNTLEELLQQLA